MKILGLEIRREKKREPNAVERAEQVEMEGGPVWYFGGDRLYFFDRRSDIFKPLTGETREREVR